MDGAREVIITDETGILLRPRDFPGLSSAIGRLADDQELRERMGTEGRVRFANQFRKETMVDQLRSLYERLLAQGNITARPI